MIKFFKKLKTLEKTFIIFMIIIFFVNFFNSLTSLYEKRKKIFSLVNAKIGNADYNEINRKEHYFWAKKILQGGYILHFRHAERDKWIDVQKYDALESHVHNNGPNNTRFAEEDYFADAVCLNSRGKIQAKAIGEHIKKVKLPIGFVISSPICRSRQTAEIAFGGYEKLNIELVHTGPYNESRKEHVRDLSKLYREIPLQKGKNTIVSGHNSTIHEDMFDNNISDLILKDKDSLQLEEGGFFVISRKGSGPKSKLVLEHQFHNFRFFIQNFYNR